MNFLEETLMLKLIYLIMQQKQILKKATGVDTSKLAAKSDLTSWDELDKTGEDKLKTVPVDLRKLSNVVNNEIVKKIVRDKLVPKVNNIDTSGFGL